MAFFKQKAEPAQVGIVAQPATVGSVKESTIERKVARFRRLRASLDQNGDPTRQARVAIEYKKLLAELEGDRKQLEDLLKD